MDAIELNEIIRLHGLWLAGNDGGVRADLSSADLSSADLRNAILRNADLRYADLSSANLSSADLRYADLSSADLSSADLRNAILRNADLRYAILRNADLSSADLRYAIGDGSLIRTIQTGVYVVVICGQSVSIGCQSHDWSDWMMFNDTSIHNMDGQNAVDFWRVWKPILTAIIEV
jgi:uncharacterized protein YjbI with pentapeptide repeats